MSENITDPKPKSIPEIQRELSEPFQPEQVKFRIQGKAYQKGNSWEARVVAYVDVRSVTARLNDVLGLDNWKTEVNVSGQNNDVAHCRLSIRFPGRDDWVSRDDVGSESEQPDAGDRTKAAVSDSIKRAAVHFGVGAYLYRLGAQYAEVDQAGKRILTVPSLPLWAIPEGRHAAGGQLAGQIHKLLTTYCKSASLEPSKIIGDLVAQAGYKEGTALAKVEKRHARQFLQRINDRIKELAAGKVPSELPQTGDELLSRLETLDKWAHDQKITAKPKEVIAHVLERGAKAGYSTSISEWKGTELVKASEWGKSYVDERRKKN